MSCCGQYRDRITWKQDASNDGDPNPSYTTTLAADMPCRIVATRGNETYRGRQLEAHIDYVVEMYHSNSITGAMKATDRGTVTGGIFNGRTLNVEWVNLIPMTDGKPPIAEAYCRELFA